MYDQPEDFTRYERLGDTKGFLFNKPHNSKHERPKRHTKLLLRHLENRKHETSTSNLLPLQIRVCWLNTASHGLETSWYVDGEPNDWH